LLIGGGRMEIGAVDKVFCLVNDKLAVHQEQRLLWDGGEKSPRTAGVRTGKVKRAE
jgi:hypothetical protein